MRTLCRISLAIVCFAFTMPAFADERPRNPANAKTVKVQGQIVKIGADNQLVVRTADNKEVNFYVSPQTRYMLGEKAGRFSDLKVGGEINGVYVVDGDRQVFNTITLGTAPTNESTLLEGTVVKVVGQDQVVIRTADGKETIIYVSPQTKYTLTEQGGAFTDLRPGAEVRTYYDLRDNRATARAFARAARRNNR
jgi:translation initiation factor IF-1